MPNDRPGDEIRDSFERLARREAAKQGLGFGSYGLFDLAAPDPEPPWHSGGRHGYSNVKDNNLYRFVRADTPKPAEPYESPCSQGCVWLYVIARSTTAPWGVDWKRFREFDQNYEWNHEEGWLVLLDGDPENGYAIYRSRLGSVIVRPKAGSDQVLVKDSDLEHESQFHDVREMFGIVCELPPAESMQSTIPPPPSARCSRHGASWVRRGKQWVCPLCDREAEGIGVGP